jgi:hypothetical protein
MRRITTALLAVLLTAGAAGCSKSYDEKAEDCAAALTERAGGDSADAPTVSEAEARVDALDETLAYMVRRGYVPAARKAEETVEEKTKEGEKDRPKACEPLSKDDYRLLLMANAIADLGWTDEDGQFDKLKMVKGSRD